MSTTSPNYYEVLGVAPSASVDDIHNAYRRAGMQWHPDRHKDSQESRDRFIRLSEAFYALSRQESRKEYDEYLKRGPTAEPPQRQPLDLDDAEAVFRREMSLLAGELRSMGVPRDSLTQSLIKRGCPERVALEATGKQEPPKRTGPAPQPVKRKEDARPPGLFGRRPPEPVDKKPPPPLKERLWAVLAHGLLVLVAVPFLIIPPKVDTVAVADLPPATATALYATATARAATATAVAPTPTPTVPGSTPEPEVTPTPEGPLYYTRYTSRVPGWLFVLLPAPVIVSYVTYLRNRRAREWTAFHGLQAAIFQVLIVALTPFLSGLMLLVGAVYGLTAVIFVMIGWDFSYLFIGRLARAILDRVHK